jgi:hypothetical protein
MKKLFKETRSNPRSSGTAGLHFVVTLDDDGNAVIHVFDSEDQAGLYHGQLRGYGGIKRIGRLKGSSKLTMDYIISGTAKQFGSKPSVMRHDAASNPVKPRKGEVIVGSAIATVDGRYFVGKTHFDAFEKAMESGVKDSELVNDDGGFITSEGRYVGRKEASLIAMRQKQLSKSVNLKGWNTFKPFELDASMLTNPVKPRKGEKTKAFIARCMSEEKESFPKVKQRIAVCLSKARKNPFNDRNLDA